MTVYPFGDFQPFCEASPLPVCRLGVSFSTICAPSLRPNLRVRDPGTVVIDVFAIIISIGLIVHASTRGRRSAPRYVELLMVLIAYLIQSFFDIFTTGRPSPLYVPTVVTRVFAGLQVPMTTILFWLLLGFSLAGLPSLKAGSALSVLLVVGVAILLGLITLPIAMATGFGALGRADTNEGLYVMYLGVPLLCWIGFLVLEPFVEMKFYGVRRPVFLFASIACFILGQIFEFAISRHICLGSGRTIDGALFQTLFSLAAMVLLYVQWTKIPFTPAAPKPPPQPTMAVYGAPGYGAYAYGQPLPPGMVPQPYPGQPYQAQPYPTTQPYPPPGPPYPAQPYLVPVGSDKLTAPGQAPPPTELPQQPYTSPVDPQELHGHAPASALPTGPTSREAEPPAVAPASGPAPGTGPSTQREGQRGTMEWG